MEWDKIDDIPKDELIKLLKVINENNLQNCKEQKDPSPEGWCPYNFDSVLCWPSTPPDTLSVLPCFEQLNGIKYDTSQNASRFCLSNGTWDLYTDYSSCKELNPIDSSITEEVTTTSTVYIIGYSLSLATLIVAMYIFWRYKDLRCLRNTIHMNLMTTYILADLSWIISYVLQIYVEVPKVYCIILIILLHYFHLTNFFWMFVEGLYLYTVVVHAFRIETFKLRAYMIIGWGVPVVFVVLWGLIMSFTLTPEDQQAGEMLRSCPWTQHAFDWIYQGPAIAILIVNLIFLALIMWVLIIKLKAAKGVETQQYRKAAKALLVLIPLLGVTYILVMVGPSDGVSKIIYDNIRAVLLSTQGSNVAILYCFINNEVRNTLRHHFNSWRTSKKLGSQRRRCSSKTEWSPRGSTRASRIFKGSFIFKKRGSTCSEATTTSMVTFPSQAQSMKKSQLQIRNSMMMAETVE